MINKKLLEKSKKLWVDINIDAFIKKWIPSEVINDILEIEIDDKLWKSEYYTYEEVKAKFDEKLHSNVIECIN